MTAELSQALQTIPLSHLMRSDANVRKTGAEEGIDELAASIIAHGLLQNLTVRPVAGRTKGRGGKSPRFEVIAGGRRLAALQRLAAHGDLASDAPIPCHVIAEGIATEISLAENALQCPMHPADQYEAFAALAKDHGLSAEDIAARFGVTPAVVRQRLKLGAISPVLMAAYRDGDMNLEQLSAFAITDDHAAQEAVWERLAAWDRGRDAILHALSPGQVRADDRRATLIGAEAYEAAGGIVTRDLFDRKGGGFLNDSGLLDRLVQEKLQSVANEVAGEGWGWVTVMPDYDYNATATLRRITPKPVEPTKDEQARLDVLQAEYDAIADAYSGELVTEEEAERFEALEREINAISGREVYAPEDMARAGAIVALGFRGEVRIERGFLRKAEAEGSGLVASETQATPPRPASLSEKLVADLTAHRTAALRNELAQQPELARLAVLHALAAPLFYGAGSEVTCLAINARSASLETLAPNIVESAAGRQIAARHAGWQARMPENADSLWTMLKGLGAGEADDLMAHCAALTLDAVQRPHARETRSVAHANAIANAVNLDMAAYWQPTVASYLGRVGKAQILEAVAEGVSQSTAEALAHLKKTVMAEAAELRLSGKGWLPELLRIRPEPFGPERGEAA